MKVYGLGFVYMVHRVYGLGLIRGLGLPKPETLNPLNLKSQTHLGISMLKEDEAALDTRRAWSILDMDIVVPLRARYILRAVVKSCWFLFGFYS